MDQIVFIGGMGRSGFNMLRNILDSHPEVAAGPDLNLIDDAMALYHLLAHQLEDGKADAPVSVDEIRNTIGAFIHSVYAPYAEKKGKRIVVDRNPSSLWSFPVLAQIFPNSKFIHLIRDGRDVACSHRDVGVRALTRGAKLDPIRNAAVNSIYYCAALWSETQKFAWDTCGPESQLARQGRAFTTFYENIVLSPESQIQAICNFLEIDYKPEMIRPENFEHEQSVDGIWTVESDLKAPISMLSAGRWIDHLSLKDRIVFYARGQVGLRVTGYDDGLEWLFRGSSVSVHAATEAVDQARAEILGLSAGTQSTGSSVLEVERRPELILEKIISEPVTEGGALGKPLPEFEAMMRSAQDAVRSFFAQS